MKNKYSHFVVLKLLSFFGVEIKNASAPFTNMD